MLSSADVNGVICQEIRVGSRIVAHGLQRAQELNGKHGKVHCHHLQHRGRWVVKFDSVDEEKSVKAENLLVEEHAEPASSESSSEEGLIDL
jgi:hypothetical protein